MDRNFKSAQRRYDNLSEEDFERPDTREPRVCRLCAEWFRINKPWQHVCEECEKEIAE